MMRIVFLALLTFFTTQVSAQSWTMVWNDEFNGTSLNLSDWNYDLGTGSQFGLNGWGNNELQYYEADNVSVSGGFLKIQALEESAGGMDYTSGKIHTKTKQTFQSGKIEARIQAPTDQGMWPAFWMLTDPGNLSQNTAMWPPEIDIFESTGLNPSTAYGTLHAGVWPDVYSNGGTNSVSPADLSDDFHVYTIEWYNDNIVWFMDGVEFHSVNRADLHPNPWQFDDDDWFIILNLAVGGDWPGAPDGSTVWPAEMLVDYVRVYSYDQTDLTNVTFRVDMSDETLAPTDVVHVNGTFNSWCGSCNPMTEIAPGIYETTLAIPVGVHEYKFTTNGWTGLEEDLPALTSCALTTQSGPDTFVNRYINVQFDDIDAPLVCFNSCDVCPGYSAANCTDTNASNYNPIATFDDGSCEYKVTFAVDMSESGYNPADGVYLQGSFNGWCGYCAPLQDPEGDDIWFIDVDLLPGPIEYKFTTDGWNGLVETFAGGESCTLTTGSYTNRFYTTAAAAANVIGEVCFNTCATCSPIPVTVTFDLDMNNETISPDGVAIIGDFNGFDPLVDTMSPIGLGIYTISIVLDAGQDYSYAFVNGNTIVGKEVISGPCSTAGDRNLTTGAVDMSVGLVCFGSCDPCAGCTDPFSAEYNPFATVDDGSCITPVGAGCTYPDADNFNPAANVDDGSCTFTIGSPCPADLDGSGTYGTGDLLNLLALFGGTCE